MSLETNVAVLVDCENAQPAVIDDAMRAACKLGRVVLRRGYGNQASLASKWQDALVRHGFAPYMQFQYVNGKNTADMALALDALEMLLDRRADRFVIVTSDSDFVGLCCKLKERGAEVHVFGEAKTPAALRHACDRFHEALPAAPQISATVPVVSIKAKATGNKPKLVLKAVRELVLESSDGMVDLGQLGNRLIQLDPTFSHTAFGYKKLWIMMEAYDQLRVHRMADGHCRISLVADTSPTAILHAV